jgi:hypothetical protein
MENCPRKMQAVTRAFVIYRMRREEGAKGFNDNGG